MSTETLDRLSDVELHKKLIQNGFPNTPVTETTRPILLRKLKQHVKNEKLKNRKTLNYVVYSKDVQDGTTSSMWEPPRVPSFNKTGQFGTALDNNNGIKNNRNSAFYNHNLDDSDENTHYMPTSRMYAPPPVLASEYEHECEPLNSTNKFRKMYPIACPIDTSNSYIKTNGMANTSDGGVVNRLLSFRDTTIQRKFSSKGQYALHVSKASTRNDCTKHFELSDIKGFFKKPEFNQYTIPQVLIAGLLIFLTIITIVYMAKKYDQSPLDRTVIKYTLCNQKDSDTSLVSHRHECISGDILKSALHIAEELYNNLNERARLHHCANENLIPALEIKDFIKAFSGNSELHINLEYKLLAAKYLILQNPQWMIKIMSPTSSTKSSEQNENSLENLTFELMQPNLPLKCIAFKKITRFFTIIGSLLLIILCFSLTYYLVVTYRAKQKERMCEAEQLAKDIVNELIFLSTQSEHSEVIINELQDKLLPANKGSKILSSWNKALKMLEENDNQVLFGMIVRNGKQLRTLTWNGSVYKKDLNTTKKWHSPAFDNSNKITKPPTPCLKIRHMFDSTEVENPNLKQLIVEAIFEKIGSRCKVCDIQLDTQSCCVYLRCVSEADAGIVHNEINGWWFDKRLISIKFLRLERYLSRFPKSPTDTINIPPNSINSHNRS